MNVRLWISLLAGSLLFASTSFADEKADEAEAKAFLTKYYQAFAKKDLDNIAAMWSTELRNPVGYRAQLKKMFDGMGTMSFKSVDILKIETLKDALRVRIRLELPVVDKDGKPDPRFKPTRHAIELVREKGELRFRSIGAAEYPLARALVAAKTPEERAKLLEADQELLGRPLIFMLLEHAESLKKPAEMPEALRVFDAALEATERLKDTNQLGWCYARRGNWRSDRGQQDESIADYRKAQEIFHNAKFLPDEASALQNLGITYREFNRPREALEPLLDCLKIRRELNDRPGLRSVLHTLGDVYDDLDRVTDAVEAYQDSLALARELKDRNREAALLSNLGNMNSRRGIYAEAVEHHQKSLEISRTDGNFSGMSRSLINLGSARMKLSKFTDAIGNFEESLKIAREQKLTGNEALALGFLGEVFERLGKYEESLKYQEQSLKLQIALGDRSRQADTLSAAGKTLFLLGRYDEATANFQKALTLRREIGRQSRVALSLSDLGQLSGRLGKYEESQRLFEESTRISRELKNPAGESAGLTGLGNINFDRGRYELALKQYQESLAISRRLGARDNEAKALNNIANTYARMGQYAEAIQHHRDSFAICRDIGDREGQASGLGNQAVMSMRLGRPAEALARDQEALAIYRQLGSRPGEAHALLSMAYDCQRLQRTDEALGHYEASLKIARDIKHRNTESRVLWGMGMLQAKSQKWEDARKSFEESLAILRELDDRDGEAGLLQNLGELHLKTGKTDQAIKSFETALQYTREAGNRSLEALCLQSFGNARSRSGDWKAAAELFEQAIKNVESLRTNSRDPGLQATLIGEHSSVYFALAQAQVQNNQPAEAFATSEQFRSRTLIDLLSGAKIDVRKGMSDGDRQIDDDIHARLTALEVQILDLRGRKAGPERIEPLAKELEKTRREFDDFQRDLHLRQPDLKTRQARFTPVSLAELNKTLFAQCPDLAILSYLVGDDQTLMFVLTRGEKADGPARLAIHRVDVKSKELAEAVESFRDRCAEPTLIPNSADLYRWLIAPAEKSLKTTKHLVVVADAALQSLPFHALRADDESPYLIERMSISGAPSITALLKMRELGEHLRKANDKNLGLLAVGIGDFGKRMKPLPQAETESRAIADLFGDRARTLLGGAATRAGVQGAWKQSRYLHFATHGLLNEASPFYSSIVLSHGGDNNDAGQLFARELLEVDLSAELVVLSACETGLGQRVSGEGVLGMSWAWFVAGVPSLVSSQWKVGDTAAASLMKSLWTDIKNGVNRTEALRHAQLSLLKDRKTRHPFFWAPFMLIGEWGE